MAEANTQTTDSTRTSRKIIAGLLILGSLAGQFAGGKVLDNPSPQTLLTSVLCVIAAVMAFGGKAPRTVVTLAIIALVLTALTVLEGPRHWSFGGIWLFDILALTAIVIAAVGATRSAKAYGTAKRALFALGILPLLGALIEVEPTIPFGEETYLSMKLKSLGYSHSSSLQVSWWNEYISTVLTSPLFVLAALLFLAGALVAWRGSKATVQ